MAAKTLLRRVAGVPSEITGVVTSAGVANDGDVAVLGPLGTFDPSVFPAGSITVPVSAPAFSALTAGQLVNLFSNAGVINVRPAVATAMASAAHGYVSAAVAAAATATVLPNGGTNSNLAGLTVGSRYSLSTTAGAVVLSSAEPSAAGNIGQYVGIALTATSMRMDIESNPTQK